MGKLDELFGRSSDKKRSELEILEEIEDYVVVGDFEGAVELVGSLNTEINRFLALRLILRGILKEVEKGEVKKEEVIGVLGVVVPLINSITNGRHRALLTFDTALILYYLGDSLRGDLSLKAAINLASGHDDVLVEMVRELVRRGLLEKAAGALKLVRDRDKLDSVLVTIAEIFHRMGEFEKAKEVVKHIKNPFHKAMALYYMAIVENSRNPEMAKTLIEGAIKVAEGINEPDARFEIMMKLYDLKATIEGSSIRLADILGKKKPPQE